MLTELLRLVEVDITAYSFLVGHGYRQHEGRGWHVSLSLRHHINLFYLSYILKDAVEPSYWESSSLGKMPVTHVENNEGEKNVSRNVGTKTFH